MRVKGPRGGDAPGRRQAAEQGASDRPPRVRGQRRPRWTTRDRYVHRWVGLHLGTGYRVGLHLGGHVQCRAVLRLPRLHWHSAGRQQATHHPLGGESDTRRTQARSGRHRPPLRRPHPALRHRRHRRGASQTSRPPRAARPHPPSGAARPEVGSGEGGERGEPGYRVQGGERGERQAGGASRGLHPVPCTQAGGASRGRHWR